MAQSHADSHDLDKLARWSQALDGGQPGQFQVYAAFIVRPEDQSAHDAFREFRSSFQKAGAEFEHLVIFGQHGVSRTALELLYLFGRPLESLPLLVLFSEPSSNGLYSVQLPGGAPDEPSDATSEESISGVDYSWRGLLAHIEDVAGGRLPVLHLDSVPGVTGFRLDGGPMKDVAGEALRRASPGLT